jgi:thioredoxin 1
METFEQLIQSEKPVLVDFFATWCGPCKAMEPIIKDVAKTTEGKVRVVKVDIDKRSAIAQAYNVQAVPTFILFKNGQVVWRHPGMADKQTILSKLLHNT